MDSCQCRDEKNPGEHNTFIMSAPAKPDQLTTNYSAIEATISGIINTTRNSSLIVYAVCEDGFMYLNPEYTKVTGYTLEDLKGKGFWYPVAADQREQVKERGLARLKGYDAPLNYEIKLTTKNGQTKYLHTFYNLIKVDGTNVTLVLAIDVTENKAKHGHFLINEDDLNILVMRKAEELILKNNKLNFFNNILSDILKNISDCVVKVNGYGNFEVLENFFLDENKKTKEELKAQLCDLFLKSKMPYVKSLIDNKEPFDKEKIILSSTATSVNLLATGIPLAGNTKEQCCGIIILRKTRDSHDPITVPNYARTAFSLNDILTTDPAMKEMLNLIKRSAATSSNVLIAGETGTGKELVAQALHAEGPRRDSPFLPINCTAVPKELIESEFFGYEEGAFTGARKGGKRGKFELASNGTIFLDEIGDMPFPQQSVLLRVLEERQFVRIGGLHDVSMNARIVCATNKDLSEEISRGNFRSDLYYRLNVISIVIPPLRERPSDIMMLFDHFLKIAVSRIDKDAIRIHPEAATCLQSYKWPGNVREVQNVVERIANNISTDIIKKEHLPAVIREQKTDKFTIPVANLFVNDPPEITINEAREIGIDLSNSNMKKIIARTIIKNDGNLSKAAKEMGISRATLYKRMRSR